MSGISFIVGNAHKYGLSAEELQRNLHHFCIKRINHINRKDYA